MATQGPYSPYRPLSTVLHFHGNDKEFMDGMIWYVNNVLRTEPRKVERLHPIGFDTCQIELFYVSCATQLWIDFPVSLSCDERFKPYLNENNLMMLLIEL